MAASPSPGIDAFHRERSNFIAFADLEDAVTELANLTKLPADEPFCDKLKRLESARAAPNYSKERKAKVLKLLPEAKSVAQMRNCVVHSQIFIVIVGEEHLAQFANPKDRGEGWQRTLQFSYSGLRQFTSQVRDLAKGFRTP